MKEPENIYGNHYEFNDWVANHPNLLESSSLIALKIAFEAGRLVERNNTLDLIASGVIEVK